MMDMKLLEVVTTLYIHHGCSTQKMFWEEKFTGEENFKLGEFSAVNIKIVIVEMLRKTDRPSLVTSILPWN